MMHIVTGKQIKRISLFLCMVFLAGCTLVQKSEENSGIGETIAESSVFVSVGSSSHEQERSDETDSYPIITEMNVPIAIDGQFSSFQFDYAQNPNEGISIKSGRTTVLWYMYTSAEHDQLQILSYDMQRAFSFNELVVSDYDHYIINNYGRFVYLSEDFIYFFFTGTDMNEKTRSYCYQFDTKSYEFSNRIDFPGAELGYVAVYQDEFCVFLNGFHTSMQNAILIDKETLTPTSDNTIIESFSVDENGDTTIFLSNQEGSKDGMVLEDFINKMRI